MTLHMTDINEFEHVLAILSAMPENEKKLFQVVTGEDFNAENMLVALAELPGTHHIVWNGETPVAVGGFIPQRKGVFRTWFIAPDATWATVGREMTELCSEMLKNMLEDGLAHRIETVTLADREEARAWYERIGLTYESTQRGYGSDGEDTVMYVAVRGAESVECADLK
jgi:hypothetical protein